MPPVFFVPSPPATIETQEAVYVGFARLCGVPVPLPTERVYSITYPHDSETWTATVGKTLYGTRYRKTRRRGKTEEWAEKLSDPATVLAIFPGYPYKVVTNHRLAGGVGSAWENPFPAQPERVTLFDVPSVPPG